MNRKILIFLIFIICFTSNGFASLYYGYIVNKRAATEAFKSRVEQSVVLGRKSLQEGRYRDYAYSTKKFFSTVDENVNIWLYSDLDKSPILSVEQTQFSECQKESFESVTLSNSHYQYCQIIDGIVVQVNKKAKPMTFFNIDKLHLLVSFLTALLCSILLFLLTRSYFSHLVAKVNAYFSSPRMDFIDEDISWLEKPILNLYKTIDSLKFKLSEKEKTELLAKSIRQIVHDLGAPLSALNILSTKLSGEKSNLSALSESVRGRLNSIVDELRVRSTTNTEIIETFDIVDATHTAVSNLSPQLSDIAFSLKTPEGDKELVFGSDKMFVRMLSCLIQNSIEAKHPNRDLNIEVNLDQTDLYSSVKITDNGVGIEKEHLDYVTLSGVSIGKEDLKKSGSGLGLAFAFEKTEEWGGRAEIESKLGEGTSIKLSFLKKS